MISILDATFRLTILAFISLVLLPVLAVVLVLKPLVWDPWVDTIPCYLEVRRSTGKARDAYLRMGMLEPLPKLLWSDLKVSYRTMWRNSFRPTPGDLWDSAKSLFTYLGKSIMALGKALLS